MLKLLLSCFILSLNVAHAETPRMIEVRGTGHAAGTSKERAIEFAKQNAKNWAQKNCRIKGGRPDQRTLHVVSSWIENKRGGFYQGRAVAQIQCWFFD